MSAHTVTQIVSIVTVLAADQPAAVAVALAVVSDALQKLNGWGLCLLDHSRRACVNCVAGGSTPEI